MRLRDRTSIRPPMRYESDIKPSAASTNRARGEEQDQTGGAQWSSRYSRGPIRLPIKFVDFDPNLPSAAFPSLEYPHPPSREENGQSDVAGINTSVSSNGPQNSLYVENTEAMSDATVSHSSDSDCDRDEDIDMLDTEPFIEGTLIEDPKWRDLPVALQVEIAFNMSEIYRMREIQDALALSNEEIEEVERNLTKRAENIQFEDNALAEMRHKQLDMLLSCDYSNLQKHPVPDLLAMTERYWDHYYNVINKHCGTQYTMCRVGDLRLARRFLLKRGVSLKFAGSWGNGHISHPTQSGQTETNTFVWRDPNSSEPDPSSPLSEGTTALDSTPGTTPYTSPHPSMKSPGEVQRLAKNQITHEKPIPQPVPTNPPTVTSQRIPQEGFNPATEISSIDPRGGMVSFQPDLATIVPSSEENTSQQARPFPYTDLDDTVTRSAQKRLSSEHGNLQVTGRYMTSLLDKNASNSQPSESASNLPLPRRLIPYPENFRYPLPPFPLLQQPQLNIKGTGGGRAAISQVNVYGQVTDEQPCEDMCETESFAAAQIDKTQPFARIPSRLPILTLSSVSDSVPETAAAEPGAKNADEEMLSALFDFDAYARAYGTPRNKPPSQENPCDGLLQGARSSASSETANKNKKQELSGEVRQTETDVMTTPNRQTCNSSTQQSGDLFGRGYVPRPLFANIRTAAHKLQEAQERPMLEAATPPPTSASRQKCSRNNSDLDIESPTERRTRSTDNLRPVGQYNLRARPPNPAQ